jgi:hypothetical protein
MTKLAMTSQWDPGNFKPLDMSEISRYPRKMTPKYENWLPRFSGSDRERLEYQMGDLWAFFKLHPISDDAEDLAMNLFSTTLHGNTRRWYENLPDDSITTMEQLEETFLKIWGIPLEYIPVLLRTLDHIKQIENETVRQFKDRFEDVLYRILGSHRPENKYIIHIYINELLVHLGFPLSKKVPRTLNEAHIMATRIEENILLSQVRHLFTLDTLSLERLVSLETFTIDFQK